MNKTVATLWAIITFVVALLAFVVVVCTGTYLDNVDLKEKVSWLEKRVKEKNDLLAECPGVIE
jgi:hypothetical protein